MTLHRGTDWTDLSVPKHPVVLEDPVGLWGNMSQNKTLTQTGQSKKSV